jgi:hypothetical protein
MREWVELSSEGIQDLAVAIIIVSIIFGFLRFFCNCRHEWQTRTAHMSNYSAICTVFLDLTAKSVGILDGLIVIRTFLSWSVVVGGPLAMALGGLGSG